MDFGWVANAGVAVAIAVGLGRELRLFREQVGKTFEAMHARLSMVETVVSGLIASDGVVTVEIHDGPGEN